MTSTTQSRWIHSPWFDRIFFIFPFWFSALYFLLISCLPKQASLIFVLAYFLTAETHFGSTWVLYFDKGMHTYMQKRWFVFYIAPILIMVFSLLSCMWLGLAPLIFVGIFFSGLHVTGQSFGFVSLYRNSSGIVEASRRKMDRNVVYGFSFAFMGIGFWRFFLSGSIYPSIAKILTYVPEWLVMGSLKAFILLSSLWALVNMLRLLWRFPNTKERLRGEWKYWVVLFYSVCLYSPYAFAPTAYDAIAMGVGIHYLQYLGIMWVLHRNKAQRRPEKEKSFAFYKSIFKSPLLFAVLILGYAAIATLIREGGFEVSLKFFEPWYGLIIGLQIVHYHLDAFTWKFSRKEIRDEILPFLRTP